MKNTTCGIVVDELNEKLKSIAKAKGISVHELTELNFDKQTEVRTTMEDLTCGSTTGEELRKS